MEQQALELITDRLNAVLSGQGFTLTQQGKADSARPALFFGERAAYAVVYDKKAKRFELRQTALDDDKQPGEWSSVSAWLFDPATDTLKDAESIANDFCQSVEVVVEKRAVAAKKAKKEKTDEKYVDPAFLMKRFVPVFPELNYAIQAHRTQYGAIIPQKSECENLFAPVACSSTHLAYGSIRMEPVFMILGHSAALAASMAIDANCAVQDIDRAKYNGLLLKDGQILENPRKKSVKK